MLRWPLSGVKYITIYVTGSSEKFNICSFSGGLMGQMSPRDLLRIGGLKVTVAAEWMGMNRSTLSAKLNGHRDFTPLELEKLNKVLEETGAYARALRQSVRRAEE